MDIANQNAPAGAPESGIRQPAPDGRLHPFVGLLANFPSCSIDLTGEVWSEEVECIEELLKGTELIAERAYQEATDDYGVSFYWCRNTPPRYPRCRDSVVMRLMGREVVKPIQCGGGRTWIVFTTRAAEVFKPNAPHQATASE